MLLQRAAEREIRSWHNRSLLQGEREREREEGEKSLSKH
jgi:hypothetical protein